MKEYVGAPIDGRTKISKGASLLFNEDAVQGFRSNL
jgi:hypothetical protein